MEAYTHADAARRCYGAQHPRLRHLAHDVGRFWVEIGQHVRAVQVLMAVAPAFDSDPDERTRCRANLAWAAAGVGDRQLYLQAVGDTAISIMRGARTETAAEAHLHLAYGWELLDDRDAANRMATRALELSRECGAIKIREKADELLERLHPSKPLRQARLRVVEVPNVVARAQELAAALAKCS